VSTSGSRQILAVASAGSITTTSRALPPSTAGRTSTSPSPAALPTRHRRARWGHPGLELRTVYEHVVQRHARQHALLLLLPRVEPLQGTPQLVLRHAGDVVGSLDTRSARARVKWELP